MIGTPAVEPAAPSPAAATVQAPAVTPETTEGQQTQPPEVKPPLERKAKVPAALARRERELREQARDIAAQKQAVELERRTMADMLKDATLHRELAALQKKDPYAFAKAIGLDINDLNKRVISDGQRDPREIVREEYETLRKADEQRRAEDAAKAEKAETERQLGLMQAQFEAMPGKDQKRWELLSTRGDLRREAWEAVVEKARAGETLTFEEALDAGEELAQNQLDELLSKSEKLKAKYAKVAQAEAVTASEDPVVKRVVAARSAVKATPKPGGTAVQQNPKPNAEQLKRDLFRKYAGRA